MLEAKEMRGSSARGVRGEYERELRIALELARASGALALSYFGKPLKVERKGEWDEPVTQADRAINDLIVRALREAFPSDGILAEESFDDARRLDCERVWMIDPLDGTKGFIEGSGDFAVQIGLAVEGRALLGVLYAPASDVLYWAAPGEGAWVERPGLEPERARVSEEKNVKSMRIAESRAHRGPKMDALVRALGIEKEVKRHSVGVKVGLLVERQCDLYIHLSPKTKHWDTCAPEAVLREAGGVMTDLWGGPLLYNTPETFNYNGLVASNGAAHESVVETTARLMQEFGRKRV